jgi:hypothetical protein
MLRVLSDHDIRRNFELCAIQHRHVEFDCKGPAPYHTPHFKVKLVDRKGWQRKQGDDGPLESGNILSDSLCSSI